jgi:hypothetical protein
MPWEISKAEAFGAVLGLVRGSAPAQVDANEAVMILPAFQDMFSMVARQFRSTRLRREASDTD